MLGGDVRGGVIHGDFPELRADGPDSISTTGQILPTSPWESIWQPLASWLGVGDAHLADVLPNLPAFDKSEQLRTVGDVFKSSASA